MNYSDMMLTCDRLSSKEDDFKSVITTVFNMEDTFKLGTDVRRALFEARRAVAAAQYLFRLEEDRRRYCDPECIHLEPKERQEKEKGNGHMCLKYDKPMLHHDCHPDFPRLDVCNEDSSLKGGS